MEPLPADTNLYLQGFAPLIQLWAGICLLFFYEPLLNGFPFKSLSDEVKSLYEGFLNQFNGLIPKDTISPEEYVKDHWSNHFVPTVKCVASMCFFYSVFILAFIGIEGNPKYGGGYYPALQVMDTIVCIYIVAAIVFYRYKIFHGFSSSTILFIILLIYFHSHFKINDFCCNYYVLGPILDLSQITIYTVFTCISGVILVCVRLLIIWIVLQGQKRSVNKIYRDFQIFANYNLGKIKRDALPENKYSRIMKRCNEKFKRGEIIVIDANAFQDAMKEEIAKEYRDFTNRWWIKLY